jgi:N utilization substance protein B
MSARDARRCALQVLYQFDAGAEPSDAVAQTLEQSPGTPAVHKRGYELAVDAWAVRDEADATVAALTPDWPTYRQPALDRCILRLAFYEFTHGDTPPKVAINEAVELAREFSTEKSPLFVNGVLDKIYRSLREASENPAEAS